MMRIALMLVAMSSFSCRNERPATCATRMSLGDAQRWGLACGDEDLGHQKAPWRLAAADTRGRPPRGAFGQSARSVTT